METEHSAEQDMRYEGGAAAGPSVSGEPTAAGGQQLLDELRRLGNTVAQAVSAAWSSEQSVRLQKDLRTGMDNVATSLDSSLKTISASPQTKEFVAETKVVAGQVSDTIRSSKLANDLALALAAALHTLNDELHKVATDMQAQAPMTEQPTPANAEDVTGAGTQQDIPIERE